MALPYGFEASVGHAAAAGKAPVIFFEIERAGPGIMIFALHILQSKYEFTSVGRARRLGNTPVLAVPYPAVIITEWRFLAFRLVFLGFDPLRFHQPKLGSRNAKIRRALAGWFGGLFNCLLFRLRRRRGGARLLSRDRDRGLGPLAHVRRRRRQSRAPARNWTRLFPLVWPFAGWPGDRLAWLTRFADVCA